jgi:hypothetical protein
MHSSRLAVCVGVFCVYQPTNAHTHAMRIICTHTHIQPPVCMEVSRTQYITPTEGGASRGALLEHEKGDGVEYNKREFAQADSQSISKLFFAHLGR